MSSAWGCVTPAPGLFERGLGVRRHHIASLQYATSGYRAGCAHRHNLVRELDQESLGRASPSEPITGKLHRCPAYQRPGSGEAATSRGTETDSSSFYSKLRAEYNPASTGCTRRATPAAPRRTHRPRARGVSITGAATADLHLEACYSKTFASFLGFSLGGNPRRVECT